jgi:ATP/maltotriose-dependent transcriptional regulator MalT
VVALWATHRGSLAQIRGNLRLAIASLREAVALDEQEDQQPLHAMHQIILAGALAMARDSAGAEQWLRRAEERAKQIPRFFASQAHSNRARVAAAWGDRRRAADLALRSADIAKKCGQLTQEAFALHEVVRHGAAGQVSARLAEVANRTDSEFAAVFADSAYARARADGAMLDEVAAAFDTLDAPLFAAETPIAAEHAYLKAGQASRATIAPRWAIEDCFQTAKPDSDSTTTRSAATTTPAVDRYVPWSCLPVAETQVVSARHLGRVGQCPS